LFGHSIRIMNNIYKYTKTIMSKIDTIISSYNDDNTDNNKNKK